MKILFNIIFFLLLLLNTSCRKTVDINSDFEAQYGSEIEKMRAQRDMMKSAMEMAPQSSPQNSPLAINKDFAYESYQAPIVLQKPSKLPDDMFLITYDTQNYPAFRVIGGEFDAIKIPQEDAYGVKTEVTNKPYLLVEAPSIQKSVDRINEDRDVANIARSEAEIEKAKKADREKRAINFLALKDDKKEDAKEVKTNSENKEVVVYSMIVEDKNKKGMGFFGSSSKKSVKN